MIDIQYIYTIGDSVLVNQWTLVDGRPACIETALDYTDPAAVPALQRSAAVREMVEEAEVLESAQSVSQPDGDRTDDDLWAAYDAAQATVAAASDSTRDLALWRTPTPPVNDPGYDAWTAARDRSLARLETLSQRPLAVDPRPVPAQVPMWAAQAALKIAGMYDTINAAIIIMESSNPPVFFAWTMGNHASRESTFIGTLASQFGMVDAAIDDLFRSADRIARAAG